MSNNYEWQKHEGNERSRSRRREAEAHRQSKLANGERPSLFTLSLKMLVMVGIGVMIVVWLLTGCTMATGDIQAVAAHTTTLTMAERISFQDERDWAMDVDTAVNPSTWTMGERIRFQDQRDN